MEANFHGDELSPIKGGELAGELGALAMSHCEEVCSFVFFKVNFRNQTSDEGMDRMAQRPTFATLLPTTAYFLKLTYPRAREMIKRKVPGICLLFLVSGLTGSVSLGSDFNPNAHCMSMPFVMNLACVNMGMTLEESLVTNFHS